MKIGPLDSGDRPHRPEEDNRQKTQLSQDKPKADTARDSVHISRDGQRLSDTAKLSVPTVAAQFQPLETIAPEEENGAIRNEKIEQVRQRIQSGYYNDPEVKENIAGRIADEFLD